MSRLSGVRRAEPGVEKHAKTDADLKVVRPRRKLLRVWTVFVTLLAIGVLFGLVGFQALMVDNQSRIDDLDARLDAAHRSNARLRLAVAELEAPDRIRSMALAMGMTKPETIVYLEPIAAEDVASVQGDSQ